MSQTQKFGIGIVGLGMAAAPHVKSLQELNKIIDVRGVYCRNQQRREAFAVETGFPAVDNYEALLKDDKIDAIIILTPPNARKSLVEQAAAAGKHIFMEKPIERNVKAAEYLVETCEKAGIKLGITFQFRHRAASLKAKQLLANGALGRLASVVINVPWWRSAAYYTESGRGTFEQDGGGVLITQAIHSLDLILSLTGRVSEVQAIAGTSILHDIEVEDFVGAGLKFENGAIGSLMATTSCFPGGQEYIILNGTKATATLKGSVLKVDWHDGSSETFGEAAGTGGGDDRMAFPHIWHKAQIVEFVEAVRANRQPSSNGRTALQVHYLIEALLNSARNGMLTKVKGAC